MTSLRSLCASWLVALSWRARDAADRLDPFAANAAHVRHYERVEAEMAAWDDDAAPVSSTRPSSRPAPPGAA